MRSGRRPQAMLHRHASASRARVARAFVRLSFATMAGAQRGAYCCCAARPFDDEFRYAVRAKRRKSAWVAHQNAARVTRGYLSPPPPFSQSLLSLLLSHPALRGKVLCHGQESECECKSVIAT